MHLDKYTSVRSHQQRHTRIPPLCRTYSDKCTVWHQHSSLFFSHSVSARNFPLAPTLDLDVCFEFYSFCPSEKPLSYKWTYLWSRTRINMLRTPLSFLSFVCPKNGKFQSSPPTTANHSHPNGIQCNVFFFFLILVLLDAILIRHCIVFG